MTCWPRAVKCSGCGPGEPILEKNEGINVKPNLNDLVTILGSLASNREEQDLIGAAIEALDDQYALSPKMTREPGLEEIIKQLVGRIYRAYGSFATLKGQRILDIACGSNSSRAPSFVFINTPFGEKHVPIPHTDGFTAQFEPWFCRVLLELGAHPVGVDMGDLEGETFEYYNVDLGKPGALNFLPDHSFDAAQDSRLFGSPEFTAQFPNQADRLKIASEIWSQEQRLLKARGILIHSDAANLLR
jgi:hypothetical protein